MWTLPHLYLTEPHIKCLLAVETGRLVPGDWIYLGKFVMLVLPLEHQIWKEGLEFFERLAVADCSRIKIYSYGKRRK